VTEHGELATWEGSLSFAELDDLLDHVNAAVLIGQRAGGFTLGRSLEGGAAAWPSGRCFNEELEVRWWPADAGGSRSVLILNRLPEGWTKPEHLRACPESLAAREEEIRYLCVGQHDVAEDGSHIWWETRYGCSFAYLDPPLLGPGESLERIYLCTVSYELQNDRRQHRLVRFDYTREKEKS